MRELTVKNAARSGGRVVEGARLESVYAGDRLQGSNPCRSATYTLRIQDQVPDGAFFLFGSKGFSDAIRLSENGSLAKIGLRTSRVSFHPPRTQIKMALKIVVFSEAWREWAAPRLQ